MQEQIILVDEKDNKIGVEEKMKAHQDGKLHRAFSIFLFNAGDEFLLQQRSLNKYHCGGLWTNTCCSHPQPDEKNDDAIVRRLKEEMGIVCKMDKAFDFVYQAKVTEELTEYEFDHVFVGRYDGKVSPNLTEVMDYKWLGLSELQKKMQVSPEIFTPWFKLTFKKAFYSFKKT